MEKEKLFERVKFGPRVLVEARIRLIDLLERNDDKIITSIMSVSIGAESWKYDSEEEFFTDYRKNANYASFRFVGHKYDLHVVFDGGYSRITVKGMIRSEIEGIFEIFESYLDSSRLPVDLETEVSSRKPVIFVGHGRSQLWRDLKDHLHDQHGYLIEAYETGARAGHTIRDILEDMVSKSSFAILVMTAEDNQPDGSIRARQNVIHEIGLFQGRLGFSRAIVVLEDGAEEFSNISGVQQIRFSKGNVKETFGDVLATLRREFG